MTHNDEIFFHFLLLETLDAASVQSNLSTSHFPSRYIILHHSNVGI